MDILGSHQGWLRNALDIAIVAFLIYRMLLLIRGTRAVPMLWGLTLIVLLYLVAVPLGLVTLAWFLSNFLSAIIVVVVVLFQEEIRRALTKVGLRPIFRRSTELVDRSIEEVTTVAARLSKDKVGALIVIQREIGLDEFVEDAVLLDARLSRKLLLSIFVRESPLHDGAVVIEGDRIKAAGCLLPLSFNPDLDPNLGTRHRAALGLSERSDAVIVVVSEQTGAISLAREGRLVRNLDAALLRDSLHRFLTSEVASRSPEEGAK
jgi:diadenylate cyclase